MTYKYYFVFNFFIQNLTSIDEKDLKMGTTYSIYTINRYVDTLIELY